MQSVVRLQSSTVSDVCKGEIVVARFLNMHKNLVAIEVVASGRKCSTTSCMTSRGLLLGIAEGRMIFIFMTTA